MYCLRCDRQYHPTATICLTCGGPLQEGGPTREPVASAPTSRPERRPMTALFADLVNSVGIAERLDPEELMRIRDSYLECCDEIVTEHGGYLAQFLGDGIVAYFGYPRATEDDAASAVSAGLAILDAVGRLDVTPEAPLLARVGVATGLVVVSERVSRAKDRTVELVGKMPNLAARLQSIARPGALVIADSTRRITRGRFTYNDLGKVSLKGFTKPVQAWEVTQSSTTASRYRARLLGEPLPFVGREGELDILVRSWGKARAGRGQVVEIIGEPGIGKSRLIETLEQRLAGDRPIRVRWFCSPQHGGSALYPVIEQLQRAASIKRQEAATARLDKLRRLIGQSDESGETNLASLAALLSIPLDRPSVLDTLTPEKRKEVTLAALLAQFAQLSGTGPVMMIVEDLHWVDATTLELLQLIVQRTSECPVLLIITTRPEFRPRWTDGSFVTLNLGRLDPDDSEELCKQAAGNALPDSILRQIVGRADGIPLYVEELTRTVVESLGSGEDETSDRSIDSATAIPLSLHDSLVARLDHLGPARRIADIGAVIGRRFSYDLLSAVAAKPDAELRSSLHRVIMSGLVSQSGLPPTSSYLFRHALIRDAAYDSLLRTDRQTLHAMVGSVLRDRFPDLVENEPETAAYHFSRSGAPAEAIPYWEKAGRRAASRAAHADAAVHYSAAVDLVRKQDDEGIERAGRELSLLIPLAISLSSSRGYSVDEVRDLLTQARNICDRLGNVSTLYPILRGLCTFHIVRNDLDTAEELARRCIRIGEEIANIPYLIEGHNALGYVLYGKGELEQARIHLERALDLYEKNEDSGLVFPTEQDPKMASACLLAHTLHLQGDVAAAAARCEQSVAWARKLNRPFDLGYALLVASYYCTLNKRYLEAKALAEEAMDISQTHGFGYYYLCDQLALGIAIAHLGQIEQAIRILEPAFAGLAAIGGKYGWVCFALGELASCYAVAGCLERARTTIDATIHEAINVGERVYLSFLHRVRADIMAKTPKPDWDEVERELCRAISVAQSLGAATFVAEARARWNEIFTSRAIAGG
jgi:class 3 adenylate cyclase/tetratricopeptide (TPR) repeat protein